MGLTAGDMRSGRRLSFAVVRAESDFKAELGAGDAIYLETEILEIGNKSITFHHRLIRTEDQALAFETILQEYRAVVEYGRRIGLRHVLAQA